MARADAVARGCRFFFSYALAKRLLRQGHSFLLRVGANRQLLTDLFDEACVEFRSAQEVWVWPEAAQNAGEPPLRFRLIELPTPGENAPNVFLLTNLSEAVLSQDEAAWLCRQRWSIELRYRTLKQVFERAKLKSRTPEMVQAEVEWL